jgi:hypothetical protein
MMGYLEFTDFFSGKWHCGGDYPKVFVTRVYHWGTGIEAFVWVSNVNLDFDGQPDAYGPPAKGPKDYLVNAGKGSLKVYWPLGEGRYHLLAPLFAIALVQVVWAGIREDRFSDEAKAAREHPQEAELSRECARCPVADAHSASAIPRRAAGPGPAAVAFH